MLPNTSFPNRTGEAPKANAFGVALCGLRPRARKAAPYAALRPLHPSPSGYFAGTSRGCYVRDATRRTPQSPFGGQADALTKTVHPAQFGAGDRRDRRPDLLLMARTALLDMRDNLGRSCPRRSSVAYATETADGSLRTVTTLAAYPTATTLMGASRTQTVRL